MRQTERERDRETERQGDRETDRQTAREGNPVAREGHPVHPTRSFGLFFKPRVEKAFLFAFYL